MVQWSILIWMTCSLTMHMTTLAYVHSNPNIAWESSDHTSHLKGRNRLTQSAPKQIHSRDSIAEGRRYLYNRHNIPSRPGHRARDTQLDSVAQDVAVAVGSSGLAYAWLQLWIRLTAQEIVPSTLSRKIIHCTSAPLFLCTWPLYSAADGPSRFIAGVVPFIQVVRLILAGLKDPTIDVSSRYQKQSTIAMNQSADGLAKAISRSGDRKEALAGPLIYAVGLFIATIAFFRESTIGVVAISQMAAGDGLADIIGRRFGTVKWPFSKSKSIAGTMAFVLGGWIASVGILSLLYVTGSLPLDMSSLISTEGFEIVMKLLLISIMCAAVELVPIGDDNISVPLAGGILAALLLEPYILK